MAPDNRLITAFIEVLTVEFIERRHVAVPLSALGERARVLARTGSSDDVRPAIGALVQRLTTVEPRIFFVRGEDLALTVEAASNPSAVQTTLRELSSAQERKPDEPPVALHGEPPSGPDESEVLDDFFRDFSRDVMRARTGQDGRPDRG
jgi:hypothetical protein